MPSLMHLPLEMLGEIGGHLQVQDLRSCTLACKTLDAGMSMHLFYKLAFAGTRSSMAEVLMRFLANINQSRIQAMIRACRSLQIEVLPTDIEPFHECRDLLPALILSAKRNLPSVTTVSLALHGLSKPEMSSLQRMLKETPSWDSVTVFMSDVSAATLSKLLRHSMVNVTTIDVIPSIGRQEVVSIKESCPRVQKLRVNMKTPFNEFLKHLRGSARAKIKELDNLQQLLIRENGPTDVFPIGGIPRPVDIPHRLCLIAGQLQGMSSLRQLSIEFHPRIMTWILPTRPLIAGHHLRIDLDEFLMRAIRAMAGMLPRVEEICLVERSAEFNGVNLIHRGVRGDDRVMAVTVEAPGDENDFPLNVSR
ncbi:hypothetical protein F52700_11870 [Fusarium sp. NRRL 52700]|nr:hypothetical protein F52700_11870 [Fusarium sp. NRRL 52700]